MLFEASAERLPGATSEDSEANRGVRDLQDSQLRLIRIIMIAENRMTTSGLSHWSWAGTSPALLPPAEQTVLRAWRPIMPRDEADGDPAAGIAATAQALAQIAEPTRDPGLHFALHLGLAEDPAVSFREAKFLVACAMVQRGQVLAGKAMFLSVLPCRLAQVALQLSQSLGRELKNAGLLLRNPWAGGRKVTPAPKPPEPARRMGPTRLEAGADHVQMENLNGRRWSKCNAVQGVVSKT